MRITRDALLKIAQNTVSQRTRANRNLLSIYLCGSLLGEDYLLGGVTDIDLVFIHLDETPVEREIVPLTEEIHIDITHHYHRDYRQTRKLRVHPWLGPTVYECQILYDPQHFMDFTQASVRGQFFRSDYVMERARIQADHSRQMWMGFYTEKPEADPKEIATYLRAVEHAANAVASLSGHPLTERRFLLEFPQRAEAVGWQGLYPGLLGLLGAPQVDTEIVRSWLPEWEAALDTLVPSNAPPRLYPERKPYYLRAFDALLKGEEPMSVLWPLLRTWTQAINLLPPDAPGRQGWEQAFGTIGLLGDSFEERVAALDQYLDMVEETLERWAQENGLGFESGSGI